MDTLNEMNSSPHNTITAVTFDVGSTLLEASPDIDFMFCRVARNLGYQITQGEVSMHLEAVNQFYEEEYLKDGDFWCSPVGSVEIFLEMYRYLAHLCGLEESAEELAHAVNEQYHHPESWAVYDDVIPSLRALKQEHIKLGVISNWAADLTDLLRDLRLLPYFDVVIASAEVGYRKPDPIIFDLACEALESAPEEVLHVGDRVDADGYGAQSAGIKPLIIKRNVSSRPSSPSDEYIHLKSLEEVIHFLK